MLPGTTFDFTESMKSLLMPKSEKWPMSAPIPAPMATPSNGTKKISPKSNPHIRPFRRRPTRRS